MADMRICETLATQASPTLGINNYVFGITCIVYTDVSQRYRVRENVVYSDVSQRYRVRENVVYSDVSQRYRVRENLLFNCR